MNSQIGRRLLRVKRPEARSGTHVLHSHRSTTLRSSRQSRNEPTTTSFCWYSSSTQATEAKREHATAVRNEAVTTPLDATSNSPRPLDPDLALSSTLNPPATTRPPPLNLPVREPDSSLFSYLFSVGKTYIGFYKNGLKAINTNRKLLKEVSRSLNPPSTLKESDTKVNPTRAAVLLKQRTNHDLSRLPIFGLVLMIFGEFTPLIVLAFPKLTPFTCRIPKQIEKLRNNAQERRASSIRNIRHVNDPAALKKLIPGHIVRSLGLGSSIWDKAGIDPPFATARAAAAVGRIYRDDVMIRDGGGVQGLDPEEVILACEDRGIDVRSETVDTLRVRLAEWVRSSTKAEGADGEAIVRKMFIALDNKDN